MEIQSAFNAGVQGFAKATEDATQAAASIVSNTTISSDVQNTSQSNSVNAQNANTVEGASLTQSVVDLRVAEFQAKASANVVEAADENLGTLLDVRV
ncbi:MAG: hypothetical protein WBC60_04590 [Cognaticolwellia sp.]|jgi:hypothetical protein